MKTFLLSAAAAAIVITGVLSSCAHRHTEPFTGTTVNVRNAHIRNGQILYNQYCHNCHPSGEAGLGPEVITKPGFARRLQVRHGFGVMPSFKKDEISRRELSDMMAYLNDLHRQKPKGEHQ
jgi:mono/diheme cytochrome c family protein